MVIGGKRHKTHSNDKMKKPILKSVPVVLTGFFAVTAAVCAAAEPLAVPSPSGFVDTESAVALPLSSCEDRDNAFRLAFETAAVTDACVQVAFGTDENGDEDLEPEETSLVVGYDCGKWFVRNEADESEWTETARLSPFRARVSSVFECALAEVGRPERRPTSENLVFSRSWNLAKVTTRNLADASTSVVLDFYHRGTIILFR